MRDRFRDCAAFREKCDQNSFDPDYDTLPLPWRPSSRPCARSGSTGLTCSSAGLVEIRNRATWEVPDREPLSTVLPVRGA